ncbi:MAG: hypothetical protein JWR11_2570, partial [Mycobacterium sp.]|nr:hypothetical protein [Mycobacterium sp.]
MRLVTCVAMEFARDVADVAKIGDGDIR